jgi:hypothetical protein
MEKGTEKKKKEKTSFVPTEKSKKTAEILKKLRVSKGLTTRDLSGIFYERRDRGDRILDFEHNRTSPKAEELRLYHEYFQVPYEYLMGEAPNKQYKNILIGKQLGLTDDTINRLIFSKTVNAQVELDVINSLLSTEEGLNVIEGLYYYLFSEPKYFQTLDNGKIKRKKEINIENSEGCGFNIFITEMESLIMLNLQNDLKEAKRQFKEKKIKSSIANKNINRFIIRQAPKEVIKQIQEENSKEV